MVGFIRKSVVSSALISLALFPVSVGAEPFYGSLESEVDAFLGSYAYVWYEPGAAATVERIRSGLDKCEQPMSAVSAPDRFAHGDIAFYRSGKKLYAEGPYIGGILEITGVSDQVADGRSNFSFTLSGKGPVEVELAHFHRDENVWPGVLMSDGGLDGVWATCATDVPRPVRSRW
jgi:hypothetical protein